MPSHVTTHTKPDRPSSRSSRLRRILKSLLDSAEAQPGVKFKQPLDGGLTIYVYMILNNTVHLKIERTGQPPSPVEWRTVLDHWPRPLPPDLIKPAPFKSGRTYSLTAHWVQPKQLPLIEGVTDHA